MISENRDNNQLCFHDIFYPNTIMIKKKNIKYDTEQQNTFQWIKSVVNKDETVS